MHPRRERLTAGAGLLGVCPAAFALATLLAPSQAFAYPSSVIFAPSGEALPFGSFSLGAYASMGASPTPVHFGSGWGGFDVGVVPSIDIYKTKAGTIAFAGAEFGFDGYAPDADGNPTFVFNVKLQLLKEAKYWPALSIGMFQISTDSRRGAFLGYFSLSKSLSVGETDLGQLTFGMTSSFADKTRTAPQCFTSGSPTCVYRGSEPFLDKNGGFLAGYLSPWFGPVGFSIDYVGGTSAVSSANAAFNVRFWQDGNGGFALVGLGGFLSLDRRASPPGPGAEDGLFLQAAFISSLAGLFGFDPTKEWSGSTKKRKGRGVRSDLDEILEAPPLTPPPVTDMPPPENDIKPPETKPTVPVEKPTPPEEKPTPPEEKPTPAPPAEKPTSPEETPAPPEGPPAKTP